MNTKDLIESIAVIMGVSSGLVGGAFAFATYKYTIELKDLHRQIKEDTFNKSQKTINTVTQFAVAIRKLQQNNDNLLVLFGILQCDLKDIKSVLENKGIIQKRDGFPENHIPERTDWDVE